MKANSNRSTCPLGLSLDDIGDRWSLLIIRDIMFSGKRTYNEFLASDEQIATNILVDRLRQLTVQGFINKFPDPTDSRKSIYSLTEKGVDLMPILIAIMDWGGKYKPTAEYPREHINKIALNRDTLIEQARHDLYTAQDITQ